MRQLTEQFTLYRECARMTWNLFFRVLDDGEHEFTDVNAAMVEAQCEVFEEPRCLRGEEYYRLLKILPEAGLSKLKVLCARRLDNNRVWSVKSINWDDVELRFSALFDFLTLDGCFREFRYVYAVVIESRSSEVGAGEAVLVEADRIQLIDVSSPWDGP